MKLLLKFNLVFLLLFVLGIAASGYVSWELLQKNAKEEVADNARLLMANAISVRAYTTGHISAKLRTSMQYEFQPEMVAAFSAKTVFALLQKNYPEYKDFSYKEPVLNPTNPEDKAVAWEEDIINAFRNDGTKDVLFNERDTPTGKSLWFARPMKVSGQYCMECHDTAENAPRTMLDKYPSKTGFSWKVGETVGAQIVSVPSEVPFARAKKAFVTFMGSLAAVLIGIGVILNALLWWIFIRPITRMAELADRISLGELEAPDFQAGSRDEIRTLAESIARMRKSLNQAMKMLDT
jgi:protein-histidine pros-kinase